MTHVEAVRQLAGEPGLDDCAGREVDRILDTVEGSGPRVRVEHEVGGARLAVSRLADAPRIDEPLTLGDLQHRSRRRHLSLRRAIVAREVAGDMRVPDQADPLVLSGEAVARLVD